jgi:hypothetical protein
MLRHSDVFRHFVLPQLAAERVDWDNLSDADETPDTTLEKCRAACVGKADCVQFSFSARTCKMSTFIKLGRSTAGSSERVTSGWLMDRVHSFVREMDASCKNEDFIMPS